MLLVLFLYSTTGSTQTWTQRVVLQLPQVAGEEQDQPIAVMVYEDRLVIGNPQWQDRGLVEIRERNSGGADTWEVLHILEGGTIGGSFGRALSIGQQGLFVGGDQGLWHFTLNDETFELQQVVDNAATLSIVLYGNKLISCGPIVQGFDASLVKLFQPGPNNGPYVLTTGRGIAAISDSVSSCLGTQMAYNGSHLIVPDPCWQTTTSLPVGGLIQTFQVDTEADTITIDAQPGTYGGYWPFAEGDSLGMNFGRALALKGDTLYVGFGPAMSGAPAHVEVFRKNAIAGWDRYAQLHQPTNWTGPIIGDYGTAIEVIGNELVIGTDHGLAFYLEGDTGWVFQNFHDLGGAVTAIDHDGDLMAVAVPAVGLVYLYEREATSIPERAEQIEELHIAPNPASDHCTVLPVSAQPLRLRVSLINPAGELLYESTWNGSIPLTLTRGSVSSGLYMLLVRDEFGRVLSAGKLLWSDPSQ